MWFLGLIIGAIVGAIGDGRGALIGAMVGAGVGGVLSQKLRGAGNERLEKLESTIHLMLLPGGLVFVLLAAMAVFSAMLAVLQDSRSLAAMGVSGGFLAPLLAKLAGQPCRPIQFLRAAQSQYYFHRMVQTLALA